jgi:glycosyltransferase involved in cell wall biosynthesis
VRVLHIYKDYFPVVGGMENHIRILARGAAARGLEVTVLATSPTRKTQIAEMEGVRVVKAARLATVASTPISAALLSAVRDLQTDITHLHFPYPWGEMAHLAFGRSKRTVITYHSDIVRQKNLLKPYLPFLRRLLARADRIIATSPNYVSSSPFLRDVAEKCTVIPLGIDLAGFQTPRAQEVGALRETYRPPLILFVGLLRYYKGLGYLLEAMKEVEATLLVVGSGPMLETWEADAEKLGVKDRVAFIGGVKDEFLPAFYQACDLFVLPASHRSEAFGVVQIEAMACGKPVVSTELGTGTSFVNLHEQTGLVVPPRDPHALAQALQQLLADEGLRLEMGARGRERATDEFSSEVMIDRVLDVYRDVLGGQLGRRPFPGQLSQAASRDGGAERNGE